MNSEARNPSKRTSAIPSNQKDFAGVGVGVGTDPDRSPVKTALLSEVEPELEVSGEEIEGGETEEEAVNTFVCQASEIGYHYSGRTLAELEKSSCWTIYCYGTDCIYGDTNEGLNQWCFENADGVIGGTLDSTLALAGPSYLAALAAQKLQAEKDAKAAEAAEKEAAIAASKAETKAKAEAEIEVGAEAETARV